MNQPTYKVGAVRVQVRLDTVDETGLTSNEAWTQPKDLFQADILAIKGVTELLLRLGVKPEAIPQ